MATRRPAVPVAGGGAPARPPSLLDALAANRAASRFAFVRSELVAPFAWAAPERSAVLLAAVVSLFVAHVVCRWSVVSICAHVAIVVLLVAGAIHAHNGLQPHAALPQLRLPLDRAAVMSLVVRLADRANLLIEAANAALSWESPAASARALAYAWLASQLAWLAAPGYLLGGALLAFIVTPLYLQVQRTVDAVLGATVLPVAQSVTGKVLAVEAQVASLVSSSGASISVAAGAAGLVGVYVLWGALSLSGVATLVSGAVATRDALQSAFGSAPAAVKRD